MYVFRKYDMLFMDLKSKCPRSSLTQKPTERNAFEVPGYVKSIYFAYIYMSRSDLFLKSTYENFGNKYSKSLLLSNVASGEDKMAERSDKEKKQKAAKKLEKANKDRIEALEKRERLGVGVPKSTSKVKNISNVSRKTPPTIKTVHGKTGRVPTVSKVPTARRKPKEKGKTSR
jgi:hypothetical protein